MNEAEYLMKNYGDRGGCYPSRPQAKADNTLRDLHNLHTIRKPNSIIVLLFTQNNLLFLLCFQPLFRPVPAVVGCVQFLLLKRVKCPPFQFLQRKQLNLVPRSSRLTVHYPVEGCISDVISSLNTKFFQICSSVTGYGELCVCFQPIRVGEILSYIILLDLIPLAEFFLRVLRFFPLLKKTTFPTSTSILK